MDELREPLLATLPDDAFALLSRRSFAAPSAIAQQQYLLVMAQLARVCNGCRGASATSAGSIAALGCPSPDVLQLLDALLLSLYVLNQMVPPNCFDPHDHSFPLCVFITAPVTIPWHVWYPEWYVWPCAIVLQQLGPIYGTPLACALFWRR